MTTLPTLCNYGKTRLHDSINTFIVILCDESNLINRCPAGFSLSTRFRLMDYCITIPKKKSLHAFKLT